MTITKIEHSTATRTARRVCALVLALGAVLPGAARAALELDENQALALFYARNLDLIAAHYEVDRSRAKEIIAAALPNPVLNVGTSELDVSRNAGNNGDGPAAGFSVSQLIETAGKRRLRMASSALGTQAAEDTLRDTTRQLTAGVRHAFYALLLAQQTVAVAAETSAHYAELVRLHEIRLAHGDIPQADLWRLKVEQLKAEASREVFDRACLVAIHGLRSRVALSVCLGRVPMARIEQGSRALRCFRARFLCQWDNRAVVSVEIIRQRRRHEAVVLGIVG